MGSANIVPGVSGGTVALIMGHYQRLIDAVSRVDRQFVGDVRSRRWARAWEHVDGRFLLAIGLGVVVGSVTLAGLINWLFDYRMPETFAVFFGMILASVLIVRRCVDRWSPACYFACAAGVLAAFLVGRLSPTDGGDSLLYLFASAAIAICAMILPGISGAFILLLLGVYHPITGLIKNLAKGNLDATSVVQLGVFLVGCLFGLLAFSRLLSWLLDHYRNATMAALVGLMLGSVEKLWPLQVPTPETAGLKMKERVMQIVSPADWDGSLTTLMLLAISAAGFVLALERVATSAVVRDHGTDG
jgi:putative membrane protein